MLKVWDNVRRNAVHRSTAMVMLSAPDIKSGHTHTSGIHPIDVATTIKVKSAEVMADAFQSLINFEESMDEVDGFDVIYRRIGSPTELYLNWAMVLAEGVTTKKYWGLSFSDGMRAINSCIELIMGIGDRIVVGKPLYGCTDNYFGSLAIKRGYDVAEVDPTDPQNIYDALNEKTKAVYFESQTNPNLRVFDIGLISKLVREYESKHGTEIKIIVDNTFPTPAGCNPINLGADFSIHSGTKALSGFNQEMLGMAIVPKQYWKDLFLFRKDTGGVSGPFQIHSVLTRGLPTLYSRFRDMQNNAKKIAEFLNSNPNIQETIYPGLENYKYAKNAKKVLRDWDNEFAPGFMISFIPAGDTEDIRYEKAKKILNYISEYGGSIITHAVSLGGCHSLVEMPFLGTHATVDPETKKKLGIDGGMIRFSVGLPYCEDQITLLKKAIKQSYK